jgi:nucleotidyltransferase substrate binding protein (TIGR01987 family)
MNAELQYSFKQLKDAVKRLDEGIKLTEDQLDRDGVIQRFEFTFELLWKTLKLFLSSEGLITKSPKEALKESFGFGLIQNEEVFLNMLDDRNQTSHIYSEDVSELIFKRIKNDYLKEIKKLLRDLNIRFD